MAGMKKNDSCALDRDAATPTPAHQPDPGVYARSGGKAPDENVMDDDQCVIAPHAESDRPGTGEPCIDALNESSMKGRS